MSTQNTFSTPIAMSFNNDMSRQWYVYFRFQNPLTREWVQKKYTNKYNRLKDRGGRIKSFKALREAVEICS
jgi:hypothetical protein